MSLIGALNIGKSALAISQAQIQTTSNNIANAGNADYNRQVASSGTTPDQQLRAGIFIGTGVDLTGIQRQIDVALEGRLRASISDSAAADTTQQWLSRVEAVFNELGDQDLSTQFSTFFNSWSDLANKPQDIGLRQVVLQNGDSIARSFQSVRGQLSSIQGDVGDQLKGLAARADGLAQQIANENTQIVTAEGGSGSDNGLRDQRDANIKQLSQLMDVRTIRQPSGVVNVYVGSEPLVINGDSRGVALKQDTSNGVTTNGLVTTSVVFKSNNGSINATGGQIGALVAAQQQINGAVDHVDTLAKSLMFELNKIHASGQGLDGFTSISAANPVNDATVSLNDPKAGLKFLPNNGSFVVHVKQKGSGLETSTLVQVDLDGRGGNDTTLNSLTASLSAITGVQASVTGGRLSITAASPDVQISFSQDSSGTLAALGVNNFFTGRDARDIAVSQVLMKQPTLLAAAKNGAPGDNQTALAIAGLESKAVASLQGVSLKDSYQSLVNGIATNTAAAKTSDEGAKTVKDTLDAHRQALSGVSLDEEAISLMKQQRAFQGAAKLIVAVDEMMKTLMAMI